MTKNIFLSLLSFILIPSVLYAAPAPVETFVVMNFEDSVVHDENWLASQPEGYEGFYGTGNDATGSKGWGSDELSLGIGKGRDGGNIVPEAHAGATQTISDTNSIGETDADSTKITVESDLAGSEAGTKGGIGSFSKELMFILLLPVLLRRFRVSLRNVPLA